MSDDGWGNDEPTAPSVGTNMRAAGDSAAPKSGFGGNASSGFGVVAPAAPKNGSGDGSRAGFGNSAPAPGFGNTAPAAGFGNSAPAAGFGNSAPSTGFTNSAPATGFTNSAPASKGFPTGASGGFGNQAAASGSPTALPKNAFGNPAPAAVGFGNAAATPAPSGNGFGQAAANGFGNAAPAKNGFGTAAPASRGFPSTPANTGAFAGPGKGFGSSAPAPSGFPSTPASRGLGNASNGFPSSTPAAATTTTGGFGGAASRGFANATPAKGFGSAATAAGGFGGAASGGFGGATAAPASGGFGAATGGFGGAATGGFGGAASGGFGGAASGGFGGAASGGSAPRGNDGTCFNCHQPGHRSADCPEPRKPRDDGGDRPKGCFSCGEEGHRSADCTQPRTSQGGCFNCGQEGHRSNECTEPPKPRDGTKPASTFIPTEENPEDLYHAGVEKGSMFERFFDAAVTTMRGGLERSQPEATAVFERFDQLGLGDKIAQNVLQSGYTKPTPVQKHAMPAIKAGSDILACAQTGSGKTAAFLLPIMSKLLEDSDLSNAGELTCSPRCLIVSPTRELAVQIHNEARKFANGTIISCKVAYGGTHVGHQRGQLASGASIVVGTTGRLCQFIEDGTISLEKLRFFVLDEADRMLDMGFGDDINRINSHPSMPDKKARQTLMFSATFPTEVQAQARTLLNDDYTMVTIDAIGAANKCITQEIICCEQHEKKDQLLELLTIDKKKYTVDNSSDIFKQKTLIFVSKKSFADTLGAIVSSAGVPATTMHGDRMQNERAEAMRDFVSGRKAVMIATAVAERGLDIKGVDHVINYDLPDEVDQYVHRIGRTGRVGNSGRATSFYLPSKDSGMAQGLVKCMTDAGQVVPEWLAAEAQGGGGASMGGGFGGGASMGGGFGGGMSFGAAPVAADEEW